MKKGRIPVSAGGCYFIFFYQSFPGNKNCVNRLSPVKRMGCECQPIQFWYFLEQKWMCTVLGCKHKSWQCFFCSLLFKGPTGPTASLALSFSPHVTSYLLVLILCSATQQIILQLENNLCNLNRLLPPSLASSSDKDTSKMQNQKKAVKQIRRKQKDFVLLSWLGTVSLFHSKPELYLLSEPLGSNRKQPWEKED